MLRLRWLVAGATLLLSGISVVQANSDHDPWYFTAEEMEVAYRYQESAGGRPPHPLKGRECLFGKKEFFSSYRGKELLVPCRFINETIRHLKEILEQGAAKYLFPLDADHAHFALPMDIWEKRYSKLPRDKLLTALLEEPALAALYHTAEHLLMVDPQSGKGNAEVVAWREKRNVLGFYDGRSIEILPPHPTGLGVGVPKSYMSFGGFNFLANPRGELTVFLRNKVIVFDITFDLGDDESNTESLAKKSTN